MGGREDRIVRSTLVALCDSGLGNLSLQKLLLVAEVVTGGCRDRSPRPFAASGAFAA